MLIEIEEAENLVNAVRKNGNKEGQELKQLYGIDIETYRKIVSDLMPFVPAHQYDGARFRLTRAFIYGNQELASVSEHYIPK